MSAIMTPQPLTAEQLAGRWQVPPSCEASTRDSERHSPARLEAV